jgi:hypothetical protein
MSDEIIVNTGKRTLTLDELGMIQPGMARLMPEVGTRVWKLYYAAQARNWPLARFQLKEAVKLLELSAFVRPKYTDNLEAFIGEHCEAVRGAIEARDLAAFDTAYTGMVEAANAYHALYDKPFLRWKTPDAPPPDLDLEPR